MTPIDIQTKTPYAPGRELARVLSEHILPAIPPAFTRGLVSIHLVDPPLRPPSEDDVSSMGRLVPTLDGDFEVELYPQRLIAGRPALLRRLDIYVGACLAHGLLPILVHARERRRHGGASEEATRVLGERLAQETLAQAFSTRSLFRPLEPLILDEAACRRATAAAIFMIPSSVLSRFFPARAAVWLMVGDSLLRVKELSSLGTSFPLTDSRVPSVEVGLVTASAAALLLTVFQLHDALRRYRKKDETPSHMGPFFAALWPLVVIQSFLFSVQGMSPLFNSALVGVVQTYLLLFYVSLGIQSLARRAIRVARADKTFSIS